MVCVDLQRQLFEDFLDDVRNVALVNHAYQLVGREVDGGQGVAR